ncbi:hypothetical protein O9993_02880 [Vibrio lentus]|nr:hypothetical protein [Vibrio lentus]
MVRRRSTRRQTCLWQALAITGYRGAFPYFGLPLMTSSLSKKAEGTSLFNFASHGLSLFQPSGDVEPKVE